MPASRTIMASRCSRWGFGDRSPKGSGAGARRLREDFVERANRPWQSYLRSVPAMPTLCSLTFAEGHGCLKMLTGHASGESYVLQRGAAGVSVREHEISQTFRRGPGKSRAED